MISKLIRISLKNQNPGLGPSPVVLHDWVLLFFFSIIILDPEPTEITFAKPFRAEIWD